MSNRTYIGDGVYISIDDYGAVILVTSDGVDDTNTIVLEPEVYQCMIRYMDSDE